MESDIENHRKPTFYLQEQSTNVKFNLSDSSPNSLCSSTSSLSSNQCESPIYYNNVEHRFDLEPKEYDKLKQNLLEIDFDTEFKILDLIPDDEAHNDLGTWLHRTNQTNQKSSPIKPLASRPTFMYNYSTNLVYQFRNFNDWRSHLIYYKQKKSGKTHLPNLFKDSNKPQNIIPPAKKCNHDESSSQKTQNMTRSKTLHSFKRENTFIKSTTRIFESEPTSEIIAIKGYGTKYLNSLVNKTDTNETVVKQSSLPVNFSAPASINNGNLHKQNIDFKMDIQKPKMNEFSNQKFIPYIKGKRAGGGVLRLSSDLDKSKFQLEQIPTNILKKFINNKSNSYSSGINGLVTPQMNDDTYYTITSLGTNEKKMVNAKKFLFADENENDGRKLMPSRADTITSFVGNKLKTVRPIIKNEKYTIDQPSLTQFIQTVSHKQASTNNFKQIANRIKKQHKEMLKQHQNGENNQLENRKTLVVSELKGVTMSEKMNQPVRCEVTN